MWYSWWGFKKEQNEKQKLLRQSSWLDLAFLSFFPVLRFFCFGSAFSLGGSITKASLLSHWMALLPRSIEWWLNPTPTWYKAKMKKKHKVTQTWINYYLLDRFPWLVAILSPLVAIHEKEPPHCLPEPEEDHREEQLFPCKSWIASGTAPSSYPRSPACPTSLRMGWNCHHQLQWLRQHQFRHRNYRCQKRTAHGGSEDHIVPQLIGNTSNEQETTRRYVVTLTFWYILYVIKTLS